MNTEAIQGVAAVLPRAAETRAANASAESLRETCRACEGLIWGQILKQTLAANPLCASDEEKTGGNDILMELTWEQVARELGRAAHLGLAQLLYEHLRHTLPPGTTEG